MRIFSLSQLLVLVPFIASVSIRTPELREPLRKMQLHSAHSEYKMHSSISLSNDQQLVLREWHQAVLANMSKDMKAMALDMVSKNEVVKFLECRDSLGFRIRFQPYHEDLSDPLLDVMGTLMSTEPCSMEHESAGGAIGQSITLEMCSLGHGRILPLRPSPRIKIGSYIKEPDMTIRPRSSQIGNGVLNDGFGYPFPNLVVESACEESREQLLEDLKTWMSPESSVQVAIGIKIYASKGGCMAAIPHRRKVVEKIEAILYRRNVPYPEQSIQFYPAPPNDGTPHAPPVLRIHLADLFFGVACDRLPGDLQQRVARDEAIDVDLAFVREAIVEDGWEGLSGLGTPEKE
jgi:hypothetical protein